MGVKVGWVGILSVDKYQHAVKIQHSLISQLEWHLRAQLFLLQGVSVGWGRVLP